MPNLSSRLSMLCAAALLAACGSESAPEPPASEEAGHSVIGDPLQQALERAESVQGTVDARAAELRERVEEAEGD